MARDAASPGASMRAAFAAVLETRNAARQRELPRRHWTALAPRAPPQAPPSPCTLTYGVGRGACAAKWAALSGGAKRWRGGSGSSWRPRTAAGCQSALTQACRWACWPRPVLSWGRCAVRAAARWQQHGTQCLRPPAGRAALLLARGGRQWPLPVGRGAGGAGAVHRHDGAARGALGRGHRSPAGVVGAAAALRGTHWRRWRQCLLAP